jgi:hypothetical protein
VSERFDASVAIDPTEHRTEALVTAAGMSDVSEASAAFSPAAITLAIARTEGWTFGVL